MNNFYHLSSKYILHVDGDSFFAACEVAIDPSLRGKPVVTGKDRGIASAMTYEAKALGITRGMPIYQIRKLHPEVIVVSSDYDLYSVFSNRMVNIVRRYSDKVYEYSIDECFADITDIILKRKIDPLSIGKLIKTDLQNELGLTFSLGIAPTKVLAKIASKTQKPNGLTLISHENTQKFLQNVPIQKVWGIGRQTSSFLFSEGIKTALDFSSKKEEIIKALVAKPYYEIYLELNGVSMSSFEEVDDSKSKSISRTRTFYLPTTDPTILFSELSENTEEACAALRREGLVGGSASFFLKDQNFRHYSAEGVLDFRTSSPDQILKLIKKNFDKVYRRGLIYRSSGVTLMNVREKEKYTPDLFGVYFDTESKSKLYDQDIFLASSLRAKKSHSNHSKRRGFIHNLPFPYLGEVN